MKKLFFAIFILGLASVSNAQELAQHQGQPVLQRKNVFKFLPVNMPFQSLSFEYERMLSPKNSFTLGVGLPRTGDIDLQETSDFNNADFSTMHIRAAYRHYTGKSQLPRGFYVEPYLKYQDMVGSAGVSGTESQSNQPYTGDLSVKLNTMNVGIQFGTQILIAKRVTLDFYFLGLEAGLLSGDLSGSARLTNTTNLPPNADQIIANAAADIVTDINSAKTDVLPAFIGDKITVTQSGNRVNAKINGAPYPWLRAGLSLGIAF